MGAEPWQAVRMADRSPRPDRPDDAAPDEPTDVDSPAPSRSLFARWWSQGALLAGTGVIVIVWQWDVISKGTAIGANWAMAALGAAAVVGGAVLVWKDRPRDTPPDDAA